MSKRYVMVEITTRVSDSVARALDNIALRQGRSRAELARLIIEEYVEDFDDISVALRRLQDPQDPVEDWEETRSVLLHSE